MTMHEGKIMNKLNAEERKMKMRMKENHPCPRRSLRMREKIMEWRIMRREHRHTDSVKGRKKPATSLSTVGRTTRMPLFSVLTGMEKSHTESLEAVIPKGPKANSTSCHTREIWREASVMPRSNCYSVVLLIGDFAHTHTQTEMEYFLRLCEESFKCFGTPSKSCNFLSSLLSCLLHFLSIALLYTIGAIGNGTNIINNNTQTD